MVLAWNGIGSSIDPAVDYDQNWTLLNMIYDGLVTWNVIEDGLSAGQGYPVYRIR